VLPVVRFNNARSGAGARLKRKGYSKLSPDKRRVDQDKANRQEPDPKCSPDAAVDKASDAGILKFKINGDLIFIKQRLRCIAA
jgi:hypothetical protein